jgi:divalent metal cation (Fe/Co/Zn/Cd) transporter
MVMINGMISIGARNKLYRAANILALITIFYNILEGLFSVGLGMADEAFTLFGFGLDSFVEVISGIGVWHMIRRIQRAGDSSPDTFEQQALKITGTAFYILAIGLIITGLLNLILGHKPETTFWGIIIALVSIASMWLLIYYKVKVGSELQSQAILADAACTRTCLYLSVVLLIASAGYELTGIGGLDAAGAMVIAGFALREGREAFEKARGGVCSCSECHKD